MGVLGGADAAGARESIRDLAGTIQDRVANIREGVRRRYAGDDGPHRLTPDERIEEARTIDDLLPEFFRELDTLLAAGTIEPAQTAVDGLQRWTMLPSAMNLVAMLESQSKTLRGESCAHDLKTTPAMDGVLEQIDRYAGGIADELSPQTDNAKPS
jgi:hypothetical protein